MLEECIKTPATSDNSFTPKPDYIHNSKIPVNFYRRLKQGKVSFIHGNEVNFFIVYELDIWLPYLNTDFTSKDFLFGAVKLTKNVDSDKYSYS